MRFVTKIAVSALQLFFLSSRVCPLIISYLFPPLASLWVTNVFTTINLLAAVVACAKIKSLLLG